MSNLSAGFMRERIKGNNDYILQLHYIYIESGDRMLKAVKVRHSGGFTLIELMIASAILAVLIIGVAFFFLNMINQSQTIDSATRALEISRQGLELYRTVDVGSIDPGTVIGPEIIDEDFDRYMTISSVTESPNARLVKCTVKYGTPAGSDSISLSTIF